MNVNLAIHRTSKLIAIEALHCHVANTEFSKFLLKLLKNFRTSKNIARYTTFLILNFTY